MQHVGPPPIWKSSRRLYRQFREDLRGTRVRTGPGKEGKPDESTSVYRRDNFRQFIHTIWSFKWKLGAILFLAVLVNALETIQPYLIGQAIDRVLTRADIEISEKTRQLATFALSLLGMVVVARGFDAWRDYRTHALSTRVLSLLRRKLYGHLVRFPLARLHELKVGGVVSRLTTDLESLTGLVQMAFISPTVAIIRVAFAFAIVFVWNSQLALILLTLLAPMAFGSFLWIGPIRKVWQFYFRRKGEMDSRISETFGGIRVVRAFQREEAEELRYAASQHALARLNLYGVRYTTVVHILWSVLIPLANVAVLFFGGRMLLQGDATLGQITGLMGYTGMLMGPVYMIVQTFGDLQKSLAAVDRVFDQLREPDEIHDPPDAVEVPPSLREIRFDGVEFAYQPEKIVIDNFSLTVPRGATVAFVGASGSGKTTLADLVSRFYQPTSGQLLFNGIPFEKIRLHSYRRLLGIVSQEVFLFDGTVAENLAYGRPEATRDDVIAAAIQANAHDFIMELSTGYDTMVGERGAKLSGGQRQRLSIARAIVADPQILILDEATSALDSESERLIQQALERLERNRTTFVIAHRLSTIARSDIIVVLDKGRMVESGTHSQLMALRGRYWHMVEQQREAFEFQGPASAEALLQIGELT
ncbi:MAG: ABC transporter ATP-binding protein [Verrucomicrobiales bacterium]